MSLSDALGCARAEPVKRRKADEYFTPPDCTWALIEAEREHLDRLGRFWEPACGDGAIVRVLRQAGYEVVASDVVDRGCEGATLRNMLDGDEAPARAIITNPPFGSGAPAKLVERALLWGVGYVALFLPDGFFGTENRLALYNRWRPAAVYPLTWRPDFTGEGAPTMKMTWFVWDVRRESQAWRPLPRPREGCPVAARQIPLFDSCAPAAAPL